MTVGTCQIETGDVVKRNKKERTTVRKAFLTFCCSQIETGQWCQRFFFNAIKEELQLA